MTTFSGHPDQRWGHITYAQHGDDLMILNLLQLCRVSISLGSPTWLDLGAHHPTTISNTRKLYELGHRGVNIEANPSLMDAFRDERPFDVNVNIGVGARAGMETFYQYSLTSGRNTFSVNETKIVSDHLTVRAETVLPVNTLAQIVVRHCGGRFPPLLLVDIEGLEYEVLASADFERYGRPYIIVVETRPEQTFVMRSMLNDRGFFAYCRMGANLFFVRKELVELVYEGGGMGNLASRETFLVPPSPGERYDARASAAGDHHRTSGETLANRFDYVKYDEAAEKLQAEFKRAFVDLAHTVETALPKSRPQALVLTALEEAYMWVGKAIRDGQLERGSAPLQEGRNNG